MQRKLMIDAYVMKSVHQPHMLSSYINLGQNHVLLIYNLDLKEAHASDTEQLRKEAE